MRDNLPDTAYPHSPGRLSSPTADIDAGFAPGQCGSAVKNIQEVTISAILVAKAYENPRHLAVVSGSEELSYGELNVRVDRLTRRLKALGVGQGATVAVFLPEATDLVVAALAVLKTAAVLVPLDPSDPIGRLAFILQDSGATLVITHEHMRGSLSGAVPLCFLGAHQSTETQAPESSEELLDGPVPADVACLLYHSSPAGRPQGILVRHKALCASGLTGPSDVLALNVRFSHEVTCYEIFRGLAAGASVVHIPNQLAPRRAASVIRERSVTVMWGSVALLTRLAQEFPQALKNLRQFVCDEGCHSMNRVRQIIPAEVAERVCGFYGSTEVGGACALFPMARIDPFQSIIPLRLVTPGTTLYVLDDHLDPVPEGTMGEIYVDGENLAKGYHRDPGRSAQVFVPNRFSPNAGARLCRTGDLAREHVGGNLELCGRRDGRSTVGGSRIEPEEIEAALLQYADVKEGAVLVHETPGLPYAGIRVFVVAGNGQLAASELKRFLTEQLWVAVPLTLAFVSEIPRTVEGQIDRQALKTIVETAAGTDAAKSHVAPRSPMEGKLAEIWKKTLRLEKAGIHDNFFLQGGNSLLATQAVARMGETFGIDLPLRCLFDAPTISEMAVIIERLTRSATSQRLAIVSVPRDRPIPLSFAQQRMWFFNELVPNNPFYNMPILIRLDGPVEKEILEKCLNEMVKRHETLRTRFENQDGNPIQVIEPSLQVDLRFGDVSSELQGSEAEAGRRVREDAVQVFDLRCAPLLRCLLLRLSVEKHLLLLTTHHIISDGWSIWVIMRELSCLYDDFARGSRSLLPELKIQYADYAVWHREWLTGELVQSQLAYWRDQLEGLSGQLDLPTDRPRTTAQSFQGARQRIVLPMSLVENLKAFSQHEGVTLFMTVLAAFQLLLGRHSGQVDLAVGVPIANRNRVEIEGLIGFFVNTLVMRARLGGNPTFREFLSRVREAALGAYANQDLPFEKLVETLQPERDLSRTPLFQVAFAYEEGMTIAMQAGNLRFTTTELEVGTTQFDLVTRAFEVENGLEVRMEYATDLFNEDSIVRLLDHYGVLLEEAIAAPDRRIEELPLLSEAERKQLAAWTGNRATYPVSKCVHDLFTEQAMRTPEAIALIYEGQQLTYRELNRRASDLAQHLRKLGVGPEILVGLYADRGFDLLVGLLGILMAGGAYLPLDPSYPIDRLEFMLQDGAARVLLTERRLPSLLCDAQVVMLDESWDISGPPLEHYPGKATAENLAYVIYTSGSTGRPKGVPIPHSNIIRLLMATQEWFHFSESDVWTLFHSYAFDFSVWELWGALAYGGRLVIVPQDVSRSPEEFYHLLCREKVTVLNQTPSAFRQLSQAEESVGQKEMSLRLVIFGGEALEIGSLQPWFQRHGDSRPQLVNMYGITETTVHVTYRPLRMQDVEDGAGSMIGERIPDLQLHILDEYMEPVPVGVAGEMYVGGAGVARGYLNRPDLSAQRFVPDSFSGLSGTRLYRSGDRARWLAHGDIEFLGRVDQQVKIRGFRIELGEIEAALHTHQAVESAIVMLRRTVSGDNRLIAWVVPSVDRAAPLLEFLRLEKKGGAGHETCQLPNGRTILHHRKNETDFLYKEVFEDQGYFRHGIELPEQGCVFDVGANIGMFTLFLGWSSERVQVYAFEPIPEIFDVLEKNAAVYGLNARPFNCGLGREARTETFTYYPNLSILSGSHGNVQEEHEVVKSFVSNQLEANRRTAAVSPAEVDELVTDRLRSEQCVCSIKTISQIIREEQIETIDLLKVDVEKSELEVLQGIENGDWEKIRQAVVEVHDRDGALQEVESLFRTHGFDVVAEQDRYLMNTGLYTIYARRQCEENKAEQKGLHKCCSVPPWTSIGQLTGDLRESLQQKLPHYMVPSAIVVMESFPLTTNGKIDRKALPWAEIERPGLENEFRAPRTAVEEALVGLWIEILEIQRIGIEDNWFKLGGHSLLATQLVSRIRALFQIELPMRTLFEAPTVGALAQCVEAELKAGRVIEAPPLQRREETGPAPLSFAQERLWFLDQLQPGGFLYNVPVAARMKGRLDLEALERSISQLMERHEVLRTQFVTYAGAPRQVAEPTAGTPLQLFDLDGMPDADRQRHLQEFILQEVRRPFDLAKGPPFRALVVRLGQEEHLLMLTQHHIVSDAWSLGVLWRELGTLYEANRIGKEFPLQPLAIQYSDYAVWQRNWLTGDAWEAELTYWKSQLQGMPGVLELPADRCRPAIQSSTGIMQEFSLKADLCDGLKKLSRGEGVTVFMTLLAAFNTIVYRLTGKTDISIGSPIANRNRPELEKLIGFFVNTLVLRTDLSGDPSFRQLLGKVREVSLGAYAHQDMPFEKLVEALQPQRDLAHTPLFQIVFAYQNTAIADYSAWHSIVLEPEPVHLALGIAKFDVTLSLEQSDRGVHGFLEYNTDLFDANTVHTIIRSFQVLLAGILKDPNQRLADLPILGEEEHRNLVYGWSGPPLEQCEEGSMDRVVARHAARTPQSAAIICEGVVLSYGELNQRSNQTARWLQARGLKIGDPVGIFLENAIECMIAVLGVFKAGGAIVPLDSADPVARMRLMLEDAGVSLLVTRERLGERFAQAERFSIRLLCLDCESEEIGEHNGENLDIATNPEHVACVLYRSGCGGRPEGVLVAQRTLSMRRFAPGLNLEAPDRVAANVGFLRDRTCFEAFTTLSAGACIVDIPSQSSLSPRKYGTFLRDHSVTVLWTTAAMLERLVREFPQCLKSVRMVMCDDPPNVFGKLQQTLPASILDRVYGLYGWSEAGGRCLMYPITEMTDVGNVIGGIQVAAEIKLHLLDSRSRPVPDGVPGEIHIGGAGLALGYNRLLARNAHGFVSDPFSADPESRLYRTGDWARRRLGGQLELLERRDRRMMLHGHRVECEEIETQLKQYPGVKEAVVLFRAEKGGQAGELVAYWVPPLHPDLSGVVTETADSAKASENLDRSESRPTSSQLQAYLMAKLPEYMVPTAFVQLESLPVNSDGELNRGKLPVPGRAGPESTVDFVAPRNDTEHALASIWRELLGIEQIGINSNFFDLGGHSFLITRLQNRLSTVFPQSISLVDLFQYPTIGALSERLGSTENLELKQRKEVSGQDRAELRNQLLQRRPGFTRETAGDRLFLEDDGIGIRSAGE